MASFTRAQTPAPAPPDPTAPFFDDSVLQEIRFTINSKDWQTLKDNYLSNEYYPCDFEWRGQKVRNVGIRSRGEHLARRIAVALKAITGVDVPTGALDLTLEPVYDRHSRTNALVLATEVHQVFGHWRRQLATRPFDVIVEDINKAPLYTPAWGARARIVACVPHLFGATVFQELPWPLATAVWLSERPLPFAYRDVPFQAISESTASDLAARGIARDHVSVIYPGVRGDKFTPLAGSRAAVPTFSYIGRLKRYKGVDLVMRAFARLGHPEAVLEIAGAGDFRPRLEALAHALDLGGRVRFLGFVTEAEKLALLRRSWSGATA